MRKLLQHIAVHAHRLQAQLALAFVQKAQHRALAMGAGQGADAHVHGAGADAQRNAPVLGQAALGDVQLSHDFQARDERRMQRPVGLHHFTQIAIDPKAHHRMALEGFDMDIAGAVARRLREQGIEHADDGRVVRGFEQVFDGGQLLHHAREVGLALDFADDGGRAGFALRVGSADALRQGLRAVGLQRLHRVFAQDLAQGGGIGVGVQVQHQLLRRVLQQKLVAACKRVGQRVAHISF